MFEQLVELFDKMGVCFERISPTEIVLTCPADVVNNEDHAMMPAEEIIEGEAQAPTLTDEIFIHISQHPCGELDWLVCYIRPQSDEEE